MKKSTTLRMRCTCKNPGQDELNGAGIRVFNQCQAKGKFLDVYRCTVCEGYKDHTGNLAAKPASKR
jgi:hypothetical protein